jgi:hypothetical protein
MGLMEILDNAVLRLTAEAKLHHMSDSDVKRFIRQWSFCTDPTCYWCQAAQVNGNEKSQRERGGR